MKTVGIIGGMSWRSSLEYYKRINELVNIKLGGWHSAKIILYSLDFDEIDLEHDTKLWKKSDEIIFEAAKSLEKINVDFIVIGANTAHVLADEIQKTVSVPLLHIADTTAKKIRENNITKVGLLGTKYTMEKDFYKNKLNKQGIEVIIPKEKERNEINNEINNIILGKNDSQSKQNILNIINNLVEEGAQAVILGCTELPLIIQQKDTSIKLFDTMEIHIEAIVDFIIE